MGFYIEELPTELNGITMQEADYLADEFLKDTPCNRMWDAMRALRDFYETVMNEAVKADRKTESDSEIPNNCEYAENPSSDAWECGCFLDTYCEHQIYDRNPDGTINIVKCGYEPKDEPFDKDINVRSKDEPQTTSTPYKVDTSSICKIESQTERSE